MTATSSEPPTDEARRLLGSALLRFAAGGVLALVIVGLTTVVVARDVAQSLALRHAEDRGETFARAVAAPLVGRALVRGEPEGLAVFSDVMRNRLVDESLVQIKIWDEQGTVMWADDPTLHGQRFPLDSTIVDLFASQGSVAEVSDLDDEENAGTDATGPLLEVYVGAISAGGDPIVVETYWSADEINDDAWSIASAFTPVGLGALLTFAILMLPLAWSLARRVQRSQIQSARMLRHAVSASDLERRRIAADLHDSVIQELSASGYALSAAASSLPEGEQQPRALLDQAGSLVRGSIRTLRSVLSDIYPPNLASGGLEAAVEDLVRAAEETGLEVETDVAALEEVSSEVAQLSYRVIREGLRNVVRHAGAAHAQVLSTREDSCLYLTVADDGRGVFDGAMDDQEEGHIGLRLLQDAVTDLGGTLELSSQPQGGSRLAVGIPLELGTTR